MDNIEIEMRIQLEKPDTFLRWLKESAEPINSSNQTDFYFEPQDMLPLNSCGNSADGDGLYSACMGDTIFHNSGLQVRVDNFVDNYGDYNDYLKVSLKNANTTSLEFHQVGESQYVRLNNGSRYRPWYKITYSGPSDYYSNVMEISIERL